MYIPARGVKLSVVSKTGRDLWWRSSDPQSVDVE
jgi:hypothetical protein